MLLPACPCRLQPYLTGVMWVLYGFLTGILLLSLLISIMNDTFDRIKDAEEVEVRGTGSAVCEPTKGSHVNPVTFGRDL
jgi:hypothetical protein